MRDGTIGVIAALVSSATLIGWLVKRKESRNGRSSREEALQSGSGLLKPGEATDGARGKSLYSRTAAIAGGLIALLTLAFAYLAVAVTAHWFPWQVRIPSITQEIASGEYSDKEWLQSIRTLIDFLNGNHEKTVQLNLTMTGFSVSSHRGPFRNQFFNVDVGPAGITDFTIDAECSNSASNGVCESLTVLVAPGPGSNLGYDNEDAAATWAINGYYQVGKISCQTYTCRIDIIPVEPP